MLLSRAALAAFITLAGVGVAEAEPISIGTAPQGGLAYASGAALAREITDATGDVVSVVPQGGPPVTLPMAMNGELDFAFATAVAASAAYDGREEFRQPLEKLRLVATMFPLDFSFFVRADSPYHSMTDLNGTSIPWGFTQQRNNGAVLEAYLASGGLGENDIKPVMVPNSARALDDFASGRIDAVAYSMGSAREMELAASAGGLRYLGVENADAFKQQLQEMAPGALIRHVSADKMQFSDEDLDIIYTPFVVLTSVDTPDEKVTTLLEALVDKRDALADAVPVFRMMDSRDLATDIGVPLHPAAEAYLKSKGLLN